MTFRVFPSGAGLGKNLSPSAGRGHETAADLIGVRPVGPVRERPPGARAAARVSCKRNAADDGDVDVVEELVFSDDEEEEKPKKKKKKRF